MLEAAALLTSGIRLCPVILAALGVYTPGLAAFAATAVK